MENRIFCAVCCVVLSFSLLCGCGTAAPGTEDGRDGTKQQESLDDIEGDVAANVTEVVDADYTTLSDSYGFIRDAGIRTFEQIYEEGENTLLSPLSVCGALGMAAEGADGDTQAQIVRIFADIHDSWTLNVLFNEYTGRLPQGDKYKLSMANSVWIRDMPRLEISDIYLNDRLAPFDAQVFQATFDASTLEEINGWVEENTDGMISEILNVIPQNAMMYLINALAFDAQWETIYRESQIRDGIFTAWDGSEQPAEMMYSQESVYLEDEGAVGFLKYYADEKYAFVAMLPKEGIGVKDYVASLSENPYSSISVLLESAQDITVNASIPKFACSYEINLADALRTLGMVDAFDPDRADFSVMSQTAELYVSQVLHKTYIAVDERGTRAGAVTAVEMDRLSSLIPSEEKTVHLDRPFLYMIIDCEENVPVFIGALDHLE